MSNISQRIKQRREYLELTQEDLGLKVGVTKSAVSQWETGSTKSLKDTTLVNLATALRVYERWVVTGLGKKELINVQSTHEVSAEYTAHPSQAQEDYRLSQDETLLIFNYRDLPAPDRKRVIQFIQALRITMRSK